MPRRRPPAVRARRALLVSLLLVPLVAACGGDDGDVAAERSEQMRDAAKRAGVSDEVAEVLAISARASESTFQVAYAGQDGARIVVSQDLPDRRFDVFQGDVAVSSRVLHDGVAYKCDPAPKAKPGKLTCVRSAGAIETPGVFTEDALAKFVQQVAAQKDTLAMTVDRRKIAGVPVTCLTTTPKPGTVLDGKGPGTDVLCVSDEGAQLLVDHDGERLVADHYSTTVPKGTFDV
jgi:hypothetical protein